MALISLNYLSKCLERKVTVNMIVPVDNPKREMIQKPFKLLVLLHGYNGDHNDWLTNSNIVNYAEEKNIMIALPAGENKFYADNEITGEKYGTFIGDELIGMLRNMFSLSDRREDTYIAGLSMGGYGALINGLRFHKTFGCIGALSAALFLEERHVERGKRFFETTFAGQEVINTEKDYNYLIGKSIEKGESIPRIFLACGKQDFWVNACKKFSARLNQIEIEHTYIEGEGDHEWSFWDTYIKEMLEWLPL